MACCVVTIVTIILFDAFWLFCVIDGLFGVDRQIVVII